ncbi:hypothetical protein [Micromonospora peucetia]|uniref:Uncharacterized protein n=1 Tax=Micromonospora peucetia TaxID=47871 RepID=A0A1C6W513_9ACTN|nr:hypothetical protein [Micromonospora peucetia]SCL73659.1 hypothetical protein GA0070608_5969 [Micromonospora peucetia]
MSRAEFKPSTGHRPGALVAVLVGVMVIGAAVFAIGRASVRQQQVAARYVERMQSGVPVGFPATPRGGADAAAAFTQVLAAAGTRDVTSRQALVELIAAKGAAPAVQPLVGPPADEPTIAQTVVVRVWVPDMDLDVVVPEDRDVAVRMLVCTLSGNTGNPGDPGAGLAGGWYVQSATVRWVQGRWRLVGAERAVPVPPPDQRGTRRDGGPRDMQPLVDVLGVRSWAPGTV